MTPRAQLATRRTVAVRIAVAFAALVWIVFTALLARADPAPAAAMADPAAPTNPSGIAAPIQAPESTPLADPGAANAEIAPIEQGTAGAAPAAEIAAAQPGSIPAGEAIGQPTQAQPIAGALPMDTPSTTPTGMQPADPLFPGAAPTEAVDADWAEAMLEEEKAKREAELSDREAPTSLAWLFVGAGIIALLGWFVSRHFKSRGGDSTPTRLRHLQSLRLGARQQIALVEVADRCLVIGMNAGHIALLCELREDGTAARPLNEPMAEPSKAKARFGGEFGAALGKLLESRHTDTATPSPATPAARLEPTPEPAPRIEAAPVGTPEPEIAPAIADPIVSESLEGPATRVRISGRAQQERRAGSGGGGGNSETNAVLDRLNSLRSRTHRAAPINGHGRDRYRSVN